MSKINKNKKQNDMQTHIVKAYEIIEKYLPSIYVHTAQVKLKEKGIQGVSSSIIRNVKNKTNMREDILLVLVEVANENRSTIEELKKLTA